MFIESYGVLSLPVGTVVQDTNDGWASILGYNEILEEKSYFPAFAIRNRNGQFVEPATEEEIYNWYIGLYQKKIEEYQAKIDDIKKKNEDIKKRVLTN